MSESEAVARDEFFESLLGDFLDESGQLLDRLNEKRCLSAPRSGMVDERELASILSM